MKVMYRFYVRDRFYGQESQSKTLVEIGTEFVRFYLWPKSCEQICVNFTTVIADSTVR